VAAAQALWGQPLFVVGVGGGARRLGQLAGPVQGRVGHPGDLDTVHGQQRPPGAGRRRTPPPAPPAPTLPLRTVVGITAGYGQPDGPAATRPTTGASGSRLSRFGPLQRASQEIRVADIDAFVQAEADALVAELSEWCAIPSVSSDPERAGDVRRSAEHLAGLMEAAGLDTEVLAVDGGQPAVYGEWLGGGGGGPAHPGYGPHRGP